MLGLRALRTLALVRRSIYIVKNTPDTSDNLAKPRASDAPPVGSVAATHTGMVTAVAVMAQTARISQ